MIGLTGIFVLAALAGTAPEIPRADIDLFSNEYSRCLGIGLRGHVKSIPADRSARVELANQIIGGCSSEHDKVVDNFVLYFSQNPPLGEKHSPDQIKQTVTNMFNSQTNSFRDMVVNWEETQRELNERRSRSLSNAQN